MYRDLLAGPIDVIHNRVRQYVSLYYNCCLTGHRSVLLTLSVSIAEAVCACVRACVRACVHARVRGCVVACAWVHMRLCISVLLRFYR